MFNILLILDRHREFAYNRTASAADNLAIWGNYELRLISIPTIAFPNLRCFNLRACLRRESKYLRSIPHRKCLGLSWCSHTFDRIFYVQHVRWRAAATLLPFISRELNVLQAFLVDSTITSIPILLRCSSTSSGTFIIPE